MRALPFIVLVVASCGSPQDDMQSGISAATAENDRHYAAAQAVASLAALVDETARHEATMAAPMQKMHDATGAMSHCSCMSMMSGTMGDMDADMAAHGDAVRAAIELDDALTECRTHHDDMARLLDGMNASMEGMNCAM